MKKTISNAVGVKLSVTALFAAVMLTGAGMAQAAYVTIGDPGNADDTVNDGDNWGSVDYTYQISAHEVTIDEYEEFSKNRDVDAWSSVGGDAPASELDLYDAMDYANWLTSQDPNGGTPLYESDSPRKNRSELMDELAGTGETVYAVPTEDEWYKAAYWSLADDQYYETAMGNDNTVPKSSDGSTGWNYDDALDPSQPWTVEKGTEEENGTYNMMGNVWEWMEDSGGVFRGGVYKHAVSNLRSSARFPNNEPSNEMDTLGFRVVAVPEPASALLFGVAGLLLMKRRRM